MSLLIIEKEIFSPHLTSSSALRFLGLNPNWDVLNLVDFDSELKKQDGFGEKEECSRDLAAMLLRERSVSECPCGK